MLSVPTPSFAMNNPIIGGGMTNMSIDRTHLAPTLRSLTVAHQHIHVICVQHDDESRNELGLTIW